MRHTIYWIFGVGSLGTMMLTAPSGALLTATTGQGTVAAGPTGKPTVRSTRPTFFWLGGGYHGGK